MEVAPVDGLNIAYDGTNPKYPVASYDDKSVPEAVHQQQNEKRIWGLRKVTLRLLVALTVSVVVVLTLAIVAGVLLSRNHSKTQDQRSSALPSIPQSTSSRTESAAGISSAPSSSSLILTSTSTSTSTSSTASASSSATGSSFTPPLGASAPRDCPGSNGKTFTPILPFDTSSSSSGIWVKHCNTNVVANNKTDLASFVVNSFDLCIQACAGQRLVAAIAAVYHWADGTEDPNDTQRPGSCWCEGGSDAKTVQTDNTDTAILKS